MENALEALKSGKRNNLNIDIKKVQVHVDNLVEPSPHAKELQ